MIGIVNTATGELEMIVSQDALDRMAADGVPVDPDRHHVTVPAGYPADGVSWDPDAQDFVTGWDAPDAYFHRQIDIAAGRFRRTFITTAPGQEMTYLQKRQEAERYADGDDPADYPMLAAEAEALGMTLLALSAQGWRCRCNGSCWVRPSKGCG